MSVLLTGIIADVTGGDQAVENLIAMIEPFMMVFLGGLIGGIVVAMYLPIFKLSSVMM